MATGDTARRLARLCGPLSIAVAFLGIFVAAVLAPSFSWTGNALSDLGARGEPTVPIFNGAVVAAGVLGLPFAWRVWAVAENTVQRAGVALLATSMIALAGVGVFPLPTPEHGPVAVAFFGLFTYGFFVHGTGDVLAGERRRGLTSIWLGVAHPTAWLGWVLGGGGVSRFPNWPAPPCSRGGSSSSTGRWARGGDGRRVRLRDP